MMLHIHNRILDRWAMNQMSSVIAADLNVTPSYVRNVVQHARRKGDTRAVKRAGGPPMRAHLSVVLPRQGAEIERIREQARIRNLTTQQLCSRLLLTIATANLFGAVLDD